MLECVSSSVRVLSADIASAVDLIQIVVGCWAIANQSLHLIRELVVDGERYVFGRVGHKVRNERR